MTHFTSRTWAKSNIYWAEELAPSPAGIILSQRKYVLDILAECGLTGCKPVFFPMDQDLKLELQSGPPCARTVSALGWAVALFHYHTS